LISAGVLLSLILDAYFTYSQSWRWMLGMPAIPAALLFFALFFVPKSPRWLILSGRKRKAKELLSRLTENTAGEIDTIVSEISRSTEQRSGSVRLLRSDKNFRRVFLLGISLQLIQQFTGINVMYYYAPRIFHSIGFISSASGMWGASGLGMTAFVFGIVAVFLIDKVGRKPLLYLGSSVMGGAFLVLAAITGLGLDSRLCSGIGLGCLIVFLAAYSISTGPVIWTLCSEIFPLKGRDLGISASTTANWTGNFLIGLTFLSIMNALGSTTTFIAFGLLNLSFILVYAFFIPETKHIPLEHIETNLVNGKRLSELGHGPRAYLNKTL